MWDAEVLRGHQGEVCSTDSHIFRFHVETIPRTQEATALFPFHLITPSWMFK